MRRSSVPIDTQMQGQANKQQQSGPVCDDKSNTAVRNYNREKLEHATSPLTTSENVSSSAKILANPTYTATKHDVNLHQQQQQQCGHENSISCSNDRKETIANDRDCYTQKADEVRDVPATDDDHVVMLMAKRGRLPKIAIAFPSRDSLCGAGEYAFVCGVGGDTAKSSVVDAVAKIEEGDDEMNNVVVNELTKITQDGGVDKHGCSNCCNGWRLQGSAFVKKSRSLSPLVCSSRHYRHIVTSSFDSSSSGSSRSTSPPSSVRSLSPAVSSSHLLDLHSAVPTSRSLENFTESSLYQRQRSADSVDRRLQKANERGSGGIFRVPRDPMQPKSGSITDMRTEALSGEATDNFPLHETRHRFRPASRHGRQKKAQMAVDRRPPTPPPSEPNNCLNTVVVHQRSIVLGTMIENEPCISFQSAEESDKQQLIVY